MTTVAERLPHLMSAADHGDAAGPNGKASAETGHDAIRRVFDDAVKAASGNPELQATREILREYFTNEAFRQWLQDHVFAISSEKAQESELNGSEA